MLLLYNTEIYHPKTKLFENFGFVNRKKKKSSIFLLFDNNKKGRIFSCRTDIDFCLKLRQNLYGRRMGKFICFFRFFFGRGGGWLFEIEFIENLC